jgi:hypothetical protein
MMITGKQLLPETKQHAERFGGFWIVSIGHEGG